MKFAMVLFALLFLCASPSQAADKKDEKFDILIRNGTVYDGSGGPPARVDVGICGDTIAAVGNLQGAAAKSVIDATGLAVAPGFINMLSWSVESLIADGRSQSEIRQGVTTEIFGEGESMGPLNDEMKRRLLAGQTDIRYPIEWTTLSEYLSWLQKRGISPNAASFIGAATIRQHVLGLENKKPSPDQLDTMRNLVRREMEGGALGIGSSLIYAPGVYASTEELIELCKVAAKYRGKYASHIRNEGYSLFEALEELFRISREASIPAEIYHLKAGGQANWDKMDRAIAMIESARRQGLPVTADLYLYTAGSNRLSSRLPAWAHEGGDEQMLARLHNRTTRNRIAAELRRRGGMGKILLIGFESENLRPLTGKTLEEVARMRGKDQIETLLDLVVEDNAHTRTASFGMSEDNIRKILRQPWVSICSDAISVASEGFFLKSSTHPRAYGNFARLLGKYVREESVIPLEEAVRRMTGLPATNLGLDRRGFLREGFFADIAIFDPKTIADNATYENPHRYATGMKYVLVNGSTVLRDGEHTGAKPGRALWGPGKVEGR